MGAAGALLVGLVVGLLIFADTPGKSTTTTEPVSTSVTTTIGPTSTEAVTSTASAPAPALAKSSTSAQASTKVTTSTKGSTTEAHTTPKATRVTVDPGHGVAASDTLIVLLVGIAVILLAGAISGQGVTLGIGGSTAPLAPAAKKKAREEVRLQAPEADPELIQMVTDSSVAKLSRRYRGAPARPPNDEIKAVVAETLSAVRAAAPPEAAAPAPAPDGS